MRNWDLNYLGMNVDFGIDSPHEIELQYEMGINRQYEVELLAFDCESPIAGILNRPLSIINITSNVESIENDDEHEMLSLQFDLDKSLLSSSNIWNTETNEVQLCSVARLTYYSDNDARLWVITQDTRKINIYIDFTVGFGGDDSTSDTGFGFEIQLEPLVNATDADSDSDGEDGG